MSYFILAPCPSIASKGGERGAEQMSVKKGGVERRNCVCA